MVPVVRKLTSILLLLLSFVSLPTTAGVLTLDNGDRVQGELVLVEREQVIWKSENFGEIKVDKSKVLSMDVDVDLKIAGHEGPCALVGHHREQWELYCDEGAGWIMDFPAIDRAEPYVTFVGNPVVVHGKVSAGGVFESGNYKREDLDLNIKLDIRNGDFNHLISSYYQNQSDTDTDGLEEYQLSYNLRWVFSKKWFAAVNSSLERDEALNLDLETSFGVGLGYLFYDTKQSTLSVQGGISSLHEDFIDPSLSEDQDEQFTAGRLAMNYRYKFPAGPEIYLDQEALQSLDDSDDYQATAEFGVRTPLVEGVLMEIAYNWQYDNMPSADLEKEDVKVTVGIGYQW